MENLQSIFMSVPDENGLMASVQLCTLGSYLYISSSSFDFKKSFGEFVVKVPIEQLDPFMLNLKETRFMKNFKSTFDEKNIRSLLTNS